MRPIAVKFDRYVSTPQSTLTIELEADIKAGYLRYYSFLAFLFKSNSSLTERKRNQTPVKEMERKDEDDWCLQEVIFVEDIKTQPMGKVLKVDGNYVAVRFPRSEEGNTNKGDDPQALLQDCRLLRKDEVLVVRGTMAPRIPDCFQKTPRRVQILEQGEVLAIAVANESKLSKWPPQS